MVEELRERMALLKERGVPWTIQRYAVLEYLYEHRTHPTAEEIYQGLRERLPAISRATVYNTLELFKRHGLVKEIMVEKERARYDYRVDEHMHFLCRRCGRIYDLEVPPSCPLLRERFVEGHRVEEFRPYVTGTCRDCLKEERDA
ncbi:MAG: transcriptional repressor [Deltaproteobacteria bacterium]|nr:MAG: transcriptional repressor [Deltaproteobacteria bacterium]